MPCTRLSAWARTSSSTSGSTCSCCRRARPLHRSWRGDPAGASRLDPDRRRPRGLGGRATPTGPSTCPSSRRSPTRRSRTPRTCCSSRPPIPASSLLVRARVPRFHASLWLDGAIGALAVSAIGAALLYPAIENATQGDVSAVATNVAYPLGDMLLFGFVIGAVALTGWRPGRGFVVIALGLVVNGVANAILLYRDATGAEVGTRRSTRSGCCRRCCSRRRRGTRRRGPAISSSRGGACWRCPASSPQSPWAFRCSISSRP